MNIRLRFMKRFFPPLTILGIPGAPAMMADDMSDWVQPLDGVKRSDRRLEDANRHTTSGTWMVVLLASLGISPADDATPVPDNPLVDGAGKVRAAAMARWHDAKSGLFPHWGVCLVYGGNVSEQRTLEHKMNSGERAHTVGGIAKSWEVVTEQWTLRDGNPEASATIP